MHGPINIRFTGTALNASWVSSVSVGRGSSWEKLALCMFLLMFLMSLYVRESNCWLRSSLCISAVFHTSPSLLSFWLSYLISVGLSRLSCLHHGCASHLPTPGKSLDSRCTLCSIYILCQYNTIAPFCQQNVFGNGTCGSPEWQGYLPENWPRDVTNSLTLESLVHSCYAWNVTAGRN